MYPQYVQVAVAAPKPRLAEKEQQQNLNKIPGRAGIDYPVHHTIPETSFSCKNVPAHPGIYANVETGCQVNSRNDACYILFVNIFSNSTNVHKVQVSQ